jgi:hypothetical protein
VDPITLIVAAVVAGAAAGLQDTAGSVIKDGYAALKSLIRSRFGHRDHAIDEQLAAADQKPGTTPAQLAELLRSAGAGSDQDLVRAARALLAQADPDGTWQRQVRDNITISNSTGVVGTNTGTVTMNFNTRD